MNEISELKEELKKTVLAYQMASEMSQFKAGFLARISHELRSPLNSLIGLHQLILSDLCEDAAEEREFIAQAHASSLKLVGFLDEIINVAKVEHGNNKLEIQPLKLAEILAEVYGLTHLIAANRNIQFKVIPTDPEIYVLADPRWLRQVLLNLVDTPLRLMQQGSINISAGVDLASGYAQILVEDERPENTWSEPIDLLLSPPQTEGIVSQDFSISPGLSLLMNQSLLDMMKGRLEVLAIPVPGDEPHLTRIQCYIPLAQAE